MIGFQKSRTLWHHLVKVVVITKLVAKPEIQPGCFSLKAHNQSVPNNEADVYPSILFALNSHKNKQK